MDRTLKVYFEVLVAAFITAMLFYYSGLPEMVMFIAVGLVANVVIIYEARHWDVGEVRGM